MPYEIAASAGKPYRPSNGTEGEMFMSRFCANCVHEDEEAERWCMIASNALVYDLKDAEYPKEWTHDERGRPTCTEFLQRSDPAQAKE